MTKILYVEDTPASQRLVQRILMAEGIDVSVASDGIKAIELARKEKPDLILMDINIGGMDGYEVTTRLRTIKGLEKAPIVAVTAATLDGDRERALVAGCDGYITKPIDVDTFPHQVREYLTGTKREKVDSAEERAEYLQEYNQRLVARLEEKVRELETANEDLQRVEKMKSDFVILAGHELRTPLTVIYGYLQILLSNPAIPGLVDAEGTPQHLLKRISEAVERLSQVIQDILNVSLIDADRLDLAHEPVFMSSTVKTVLHNLRSFGPQRQLIFEIGPGLKNIPVIEGDPRRLHQAIWNVISNAIKYTPDHGLITIDGKVIEKQTAHIWIKDTGIGIPADELTHIFKRFYVLEDVSLHRSSKTAFKGGGMGLGLSVAKGIIEAHGGKIWAESGGQDEEKLPGSTIHLLLPLGNVSLGDRS
ncbi:MAG: hybrid sensor histidine kinase/response regulator [Anaerolineae bacterium]|nr:hybrid sensor histidine kinase/response regulator [Anaerolineae bacterium]